MGNMMRNSKFAFAFAILLFSIVGISSVSAITASIGNAKMIISTEVEPRAPTHIDRTVLVRNVNNISVDVEVVTLGDITEMATVLDDKFSLEPGEEKNARFRVSIDRPGYYEGRVAVSFLGKVGDQTSGAGLQSQVIIIADPAEGFTDSDFDYLDEQGDGDTQADGDGQSGDDDGQAGDGEIGDDVNQGNDSSGSRQPNSKTGANPIFGILIMIVIVAIGVVLYMIFSSPKD